VGNENGQIQDLDARRKITTKTRRSRSNNNNYSLSPVTVFAVTSFDKKENLAPPLTPRGFFFGRMASLHRHPVRDRIRAAGRQSAGGINRAKNLRHAADRRACVLWPIK
jgi:hypothetical protein